MDIAGYIDHTMLKPDATAEEITTLCNQAIHHNFCSVCVNPVWVPLSNEILRNAQPLVCSVVGFPLGATPFAGAEAQWVVSKGAGEVDMVIPLGALKMGDAQVVRKAISDVVEAVPGVPVKVIIETCLLTTEEKIIACNLSRDAGAAFVKTSTGFAGGGATVEDVSLMRRTVGNHMGVKASGGIKTYEQAVAMIEAGASRLGTSSSISIVNGSK